MVLEAGFLAVGTRSIMGAILFLQQGLHLSATIAEPGHFSAPESIILVLCVLVSVGLFFWRFGPILRNIFRSKKDADFSLQPIGRRVWDFFWEVLCQGKVIRQRVKEIKTTGRLAQGVRLIKMGDDDRLVSVVNVPKDAENGEAGEAKE